MTETPQSRPDATHLQSPRHQSSTPITLEISGRYPQTQTGDAGIKRPMDAQKPRPVSPDDKATASFVRRVLCPDNVLLGPGDKGYATPCPIEQLLPSLTSSNEVDLQLYGIISVIIKDFVQTWYSKVTPDHVFVDEVIQIIAHCTRALEQRLRTVDLEALLLDEIPELLEVHLSSCHLAKQQVMSTNSLASDPRLIYHTIHPHPALSPVPTELIPSTIVEQRESESVWRQLLVQGVLAVLLPSEDLENTCIRALVAEILAETILGNGISGKVCEGWFMWETITRVAQVLQADGTKETVDQSVRVTRGRPSASLERSGLLESPDNSEAESRQPLESDPPCQKTNAATFLSYFWMILQYAFWTSAAVRTIILTLARASSLPSRFTAVKQSPVKRPGQSPMQRADTALPTRSLGTKRPIVSMKLWSWLAQVVELDVRMPWLLGILSMFHHGVLAGPGRVGETDGILDRLLSHTVHMRILNPDLLPGLLQAVRTSLFPNNSLGPARQIPAADEAREIKRRCALTLLTLFPPRLASALLADPTHSKQLEQVEDILDSFDDTHLNKHLVFQIVELVVLRLVPELGHKSVRDMLQERCSDDIP